MDPQSKDLPEIDFKRYKKIEEREICPTKEVDEAHFIEPDLAWFLHLFQFLFNPNPKFFVEIFNCVHCNSCDTSNSRYYLKRKLHNSGFKSNYTEIMIESFKQFDTPFNQSDYRLTIPDNVPKKSENLLFMGCLSTIKVPKFTLNAINYMLGKKHHFTILEREVCCGIPLFDSGESEILSELMKKNVKIFNSSNYKKIVCVCPACYDVFNTQYDGIKAEVVFISDYLEPLKNKRNETLSIQHLCQLENRGRKDVRVHVDKVLKDSGFKIMENEKHWCCGGGMGMMHIVDTIEQITRIRVNDFHGDILTTYCPSCYHVLKLFSRREKIKPKLIDTFKLLTE
ncbi:MAG: (Fe-S)-binding protein [Candidatus Helarchaeota archaeon]|nr:(Fe-S)-binding protein [Candidatus Helarchaeota archaeon]